MERVANANGSMQLKLQDSQEEIKKLEAEKAEKEATILKLTKEVEEMREKFTKIDLEKQQGGLLSSFCRNFYFSFSSSKSC